MNNEIKEQRATAFIAIVRKLVDTDRSYGGLFDCGQLGFCYVYWSRFAWDCKWFNEAESFADFTKS